ncbi:MAG: hydroxypyruvate isomerase family protein [Thermomicrobiales bacterium]
MPKLSANLTMLFAEHPFLERFDRAAAAGFKGVEFQFPYAEDVADIQEALQRNDLELVLFNLPAGDWAAGDRGVAAQPDRREEFGTGILQAVKYALALHPPRINCLAGKAGEGADSDAVLIANVSFAAEALRAIGVQLVIEPVNDKDVPDFAIPTTRAAIELIAEVESSNVGLQYDVYHSIRMGEDPFAIIPEHVEQIAHIQIADVPGRHQPGTGAVDFVRLFDVIDQTGYANWVGLEYNPEGPTEDGFGLLRDLHLLG